MVVKRSHLIGRTSERWLVDAAETITRRSGCENCDGRSKTLLATVKMAVFAPMPSARVKIATAVNAGALASMRSAVRASWTSVLVALDSQR